MPVLWRRLRKLLADTTIAPRRRCAHGINRRIHVLILRKYPFAGPQRTRSERNRLGRLRRIPYDDEYGMHLGVATHFTLLNHPAVYDRLRDWLAVTPVPS